MRATFAIALACLPAIALRAQQRQPVPGAFASVVGVVVDSVHGGPLSGALVVVAGTDAQATVDSQGRFRIDSIAPGPHQLGVFHPLLDSLGVAVGTGSLQFDSGTATSVVLATPSVPSVIALYCSADERQRGQGAIIGRVTNADSDTPVSDATVRYTWGMFGKAFQTRETHVTKLGDYRICGLPLGIRGTIRASSGAHNTSDMPVEVATRPLAIEALHMPRASATSGAVVNGRIVDAHGIPLSGVNVIYDSTARTVTNNNGAFSLRGLPAGSHTLAIRKVGFQATDAPVDLSASQPASLTLALNPAPPVLATVNVTASRQAALDRVGFTSRTRTTAGAFLTAADIAKRDPIVFSDLARTVSGLRVVMRNGQSVVTQTAGESGAGVGCVLYEEPDGIAFDDNPPGTIDAHVQPQSIIAMEVYRPGAAPLQILQDATPGEFGAPPLPSNGRGQHLQSAGSVQGMGSMTTTACTVVVIWTKATSLGN